MLALNTKLEGMHGQYGTVHHALIEYGFNLGDNWDFDNGCFDAVLSREEDETIYLRLPFKVVDGILDQARAEIVFGTPYVIKHIYRYGLDTEGSSLLTATGFSQFQSPVDKDGNIENESHWEHAGKEVVAKVLDVLPIHPGEKAEIDEDNTEDELKAEED